MRIGVDAREFEKGRYTGLRTIVRNFLFYADYLGKHEFIMFCNQDTDLESLASGHKKVVIPENYTFLWDQWLLPKALKENKIDVFFSPYIKTPFWRVCPYVNAISDIIPLAISRFTGIKAVLEKIHFFLYAFLCGHRATKCITLSHDAKNKVSKTFGIDAEKIIVVYPSVEINNDIKREKEVIEKYRLDSKYILYVGNFKPHKNLGNLMAAYNILPDEVKQAYRLFLVGGSEKELPSVEKDILDKKLTGMVVPVANISHDDICAFLKNASVFAFPSLAEGFGIPPVEAMAAGVPVASSDFLPMTEVLGDSAIFFDPHNEQEIADSLLKLINDDKLREQCVVRGRLRAEVFNPTSEAKGIMRVLENAAGGKTLLVSSEFPPITGGIATHIYNLWKRLPRENTIVFTIKAKTTSKKIDENFNIVRRSYPMGGGMISRVIRTILVSWHVFRLNSLFKIKRNHCAQIMSSGVAGLLMKKIKNIPYTVYVYSADLLEFSNNPISKWLMKMIFSESEHIIAISGFAKSIIVKRNLAPVEKVVLVLPGVDTEMFNPEKVDEDIRKKYKIPENGRVLLTVSRLDPRKGHESVINLMPEVLKEHPDVVYLVVGSGPMEGELNERVKNNGLEGKVIFTGDISLANVVYFYNLCDVFIMVPHYIEGTGNIEGFGIVFLEAGACNKPVIAGRSGGVEEAVVDGETGILVYPESIDQIKSAILRLLGDKDYAASLGEKVSRGPLVNLAGIKELHY